MMNYSEKRDLDYELPVLYLVIIDMPATCLLQVKCNEQQISNTIALGVIREGRRETRKHHVFQTSTSMLSTAFSGLHAADIDA